MAMVGRILNTSVAPDPTQQGAAAAVARINADEP